MKRKRYALTKRKLNDLEPSVLLGYAVELCGYLVKDAKEADVEIARLYWDKEGDTYYVCADLKREHNPPGDELLCNESGPPY